MQITIIFLLGLSIVAVTANGMDGWMVPQLNGTTKFMSKLEWQAILKNSLKRSASPSLLDVQFRLFTRNNPTKERRLKAYDFETFRSSKLHVGVSTKFIIHDWGSGANAKSCYSLRDAYLLVGDVNVICVDWGSKGKLISYNKTRMLLANIGKLIANFIDYATSVGCLEYSNIDIIGFGLGAHLAGYAGKQMLHGSVRRILGVDPLYPLFDEKDPKTRLSRNDAQYVETIHSAGGNIVFTYPIGEAAFFPNGGILQPGCDHDHFGACSRLRAVDYVHEAIVNNTFLSYICRDINQAIHKQCKTPAFGIRMASDINIRNAKGIFYVPVNQYPLFGKGST